MTPKKKEQKEMGGGDDTSQNKKWKEMGIGMTPFRTRNR